MATRPTPRSRTSTSASASAGSGSSRRPARASSSGSQSMPLILGGVGLLVVVVVLVMMNSGGGGEKPAEAAPKPAAAPAAEQPKVSGAVPSGTARSGKTPARAAPALTPQMLQQTADLLAEAKTLCNDGITARTAGDNQGARDKQSAAKDKIDAVKQLIAAPLGWQEEADLEGWAMPAEYSALEKLYGQLSSLEKRVRMSGGT